MTTTFERAYVKVHQLAESFQAHEHAYLATGYSEAQIRQDFIDKFLTAIGWDIAHNFQQNPFAQEVKVERDVHVGPSQRRADYAFYIDPNFRDVRFYVEAKKPTADIATKDNYFQTIRYGWNSQVPLAVLTDFRQLHILDCRHKPDIDSALQHAVRTYDCSDYADKEKFAEIYYLFSREAVGHGSLEKFAETLPGRRGKAVQRGLFKGGWQSIDESFLEELDEYRDALARTFKTENPHLDGETLTEIAQRTLDRLVLLRFLEDKLIETRERVASFGDKTTVWGDFIAACRRLDGTYNGIVFKEHALLDSSKLKLDDNAFGDICESLSHINSPYDFNVIPIHILGSIYERFLGKVIVATDKRARVEEKPEVRKAGGVYYTPQYIVRYIVENTVGKLIAGKTPAQIAELRFADIACGSGSFLLGMYDCLLRYHRNWYNAQPHKTKEGDCITHEDGTLHLSLAKKRGILLNNIYGVDIDHQAVEVANLSLYLKLLEEETTASARNHQLEFHETLLPSLTNNIVCGNSLIGLDILEGDLFSLDQERKLNPMSFDDRFPTIMRRGGFDAIIGNPPYVLLEDEFRDDRQLKYFRSKYTCASFKLDTYHLFIEKGLRLLRKSGRFSLITPTNFLTNNYLESLRRFLLNESKIERILVFDGGVFKGVSVNNAIFVIGGRGKTTRTFPVLHVAHQGTTIEPLLKAQVSPAKALSDRYVLFTGSAERGEHAVWVRVSTHSSPLSTVAKVNFGKQLRDRRKYEQDVISIGTLKDVPETHRPCYTGRDVVRYLVTWSGLACLDSKEAQSGGCWDDDMQNAKNKLLTRQIGRYPEFALDARGYQCLNTMFMVNVTDPQIHPVFLLGILNSKLTRSLWVSRFYDQRRTFPKIKGAYLKQLPIASPISDKSKSERLVHYVEQMLQAKKNWAVAVTDRDRGYYENRCRDLDRQIDALVYGLYGLTEEEIRIVENSSD